MKYLTLCFLIRSLFFHDVFDQTCERVRHSLKLHTLDSRAQRRRSLMTIIKSNHLFLPFFVQLFHVLAICYCSKLNFNRFFIIVSNFSFLLSSSYYSLAFDDDDGVSHSSHTHVMSRFLFFSLFLPQLLHAQSDANFSFLFANLISFTVHIFLSMSASRSRFFHYCRLLFSTRLQTNVSCCFFYCVVFFSLFLASSHMCVLFYPSYEEIVWR